MNSIQSILRPVKSVVKPAVFFLTGKKPQLQASPSRFVKWIGFANAGMLNPGNVYCFEYAIQRLPSGNPVIEIGSFCGLSANIISYYLRKFGKSNKLITCDKWIFERAEKQHEFLDGSSIRNEDIRNFVKESYIRNISFFSKENLPYTVEEFSDDFFSRWDKEEMATDVMGRNIQLGGKISFAYIDGNHTIEYAKRDFSNVDRHLEKGGFILFDDSYSKSEWEVNKVVKEVLGRGDYELVLENPNFLIRKIR